MLAMVLVVAVGLFVSVLLLCLPGIHCVGMCDGGWICFAVSRSNSRFLSRFLSPSLVPSLPLSPSRSGGASLPVVAKSSASVVSKDMVQTSH